METYDLGRHGRYVSKIYFDWFEFVIIKLVPNFQSPIEEFLPLARVM